MKTSSATIGLQAAHAQTNQLRGVLADYLDAQQPVAVSLKIFISPVRSPTIWPPSVVLNAKGTADFVIDFLFFAGFFGFAYC